MKFSDIVYDPWFQAQGNVIRQEDRDFKEINEV